ncbi:DNA polymerase III subunit delta [Thiohalorhabdus denitrificans]|uniref:DNA polymerase III subunit delta n=1 Tax=Thiohalorhabdus denitrificans TaxID=381306 RepID=A0A1G5C964_9GAMM|nr:DNA polymerase III subunit delta [Thiohalorhabdus denitrificans]SCX98814.1 DNA polymerase III, delta subunit [Thiohalorhabdus denitrificans]
MALRSVEELEKRLHGQPPPVILVHSDAPLLREEAAERVRSVLLADPEVERHAFRADDQVDYTAIRQELAAPSLFAPRRLVEIHYGGGAPKDEGGKWLQEYCADPAPDVVLLLTAGYQSKKDQQKKWFRAVEEAGLTLARFAPRRHELPDWLRGRAAGYGLELSPDALTLLAERVEGNLEAAAGEVEKLALYTGGPARLDVDGVLAAVGDQARFSVFDLAEAALARDPRRTVRAVAALRAEGAELPAVVGAMAREVRNVIVLRDRHRRGGDLEAACKELKLFPPRKQAAQKLARNLGEGEAERVLAALARVDRMSKGAEAGDPWAALEDAALALAGVETGLPAGA